MERIVGSGSCFNRPVVATKLGYLRKNGRAYELTDKAAYLYHGVEQAYTTAYIDKMWHTSRLQPFPEKIILK
ncbi:hypothetical protein [uncultured Trichococcus sp.]|uniref:hypothetical protein n=1 Tax=uncultured Trichococcus sp. TaxID=189665 RepID=UPI0029C9247F|nr:hypothetical protein [uncultured Trichococcus sp.]